MSSGKDGSFRIADLQRPVVKRSGPPGRRGAKAEAPPVSSTGFPFIEQLIEGSDVEAVVAGMRPRYEALEAMASGGPVKQRGLAKKAMGAYERAADLFEYLFETKDALSRGS